MGSCIKSNKLNKIQVIKTSNGVDIFTSTTDIHEIYTFGKIMGLGVFGKVMKAKMKSNDEKLFAIKVVEKSKIQGKETQLSNEIYVLQRLDHPNINKQNYYICMEYCGGGELIKRIPQHQNQLTEKQCQKIAQKILSAMAYMHEQGIIHRDIKPENILFSQRDLNSEPKIIDFGMAIKLEEVKNISMGCVGTPLYVSPEAIDGYFSDKCDIWSFGIMLFYLLCRYPPFYAGNRKDLFQKIQNQELIFDSRHWNLLSKEVKKFLKRILCKNPLLRPSAKELLKDEWFNIALIGVEQKNLRRSKTRATTTFRQIAPNDYFEDCRSIYQMLKNYKNGARFKKEVMKVLINLMNEKELEHLKRIFLKIDEDNSGTITYRELQKAFLKEGSKVSQEEIKRLMMAIGFENDDETEDCSSVKSYKPLIIKYSDFLLACIDEKKVLTKDKLFSLFKYFDTQNMNFITKENIQEIFARHGKALTENKINEMIYEIDPNHDYKITFEEFCQMMSTDINAQLIEQKEANIEQYQFSPINQKQSEMLQFQ